MKKFRSAFFGGYQREEVDDYIEALISELERVKTNSGSENAQELEEMKEQVQQERKEKDSLINQLGQLEAKIKSHSVDNEKEVQNLREELARYKENGDSKDELEKATRQLEDERREKGALLKRIAELEEKVNERNDEKEKEIQEMREQLDKYKSSYDVLANVVSAAKKDADKLVNDARENAQQLTSQAKKDADKLLYDAQADAQMHRDKVEKELKEKREADGKRYMLAKYKLMEYLNSLNRSQSQLIKTYNELGEIVKKMPIRVEDVFSDDPMEFLPNAEEDGNPD